MRKFFSLIAAFLFAGSMMADNFSLVSDVSSLADGDQIIIVNAGSTKAMSTTQNNNNRGAADVTATAGVIVPGADVQVIAIEATEGNWKLNVGDSKYLYASSNSSNQLKSAVEATAGANGVWAISITNDVASIVAQGSNSRNVMQFNGTSNLFACYASASQTGLKIYKKDAKAPAVATPAISGETGFFDETEVSITCATEDAKIYYTLDGSEPTASSSAYSAAFKLNATATVKAIAIKGEDKSAIATKVFTKAPEYASIEALVAAGLATGTKMQVSFEGKEITDIFTYNNNRRGIFLNVKAGGKDVEIYYSSDNVPEAWTIGGTVSGTIKATWTYYNNSQWEIVPAVEGWKWTNLTYEAPAGVSIMVKSTSIEVPAAGKSATVDVEYINIADLSSAAVALYEADGTTPATYAWLQAGLDENNDLAYEVAANANVEARTAYLKVYVGEVYSDLVTITQAGYVPDYAVLPFAFDEGKAEIANTQGLTQSGLGSDYNSSPKLKFDGTGDCLILKFNEDAGKLSYDIKGNSFSEGTFTVQTSVDGETYINWKAYTELGATQSDTLSIAPGIRYIKWIYTEKVNGNVALGNIALAKPYATAIENAAIEPKVIKRIENGKLVIIKNGVRYDAQGIRF